MSNVTIARGTVVSIVKDTPASYNAAGYGKLSGWLKCGEVTGLGTFGGSATVATHIPIATGIVDKHIGSIDYGQLTLTFGEDTADKGQASLKAGFDGANKGLEHAVMLVIPTAAGGTVTRYTSGKISSYECTLSDADGVITAASNIELTNSVIAGA